MNENTIKRNLPRDVFLHIFSIVALYWSAVNFLVLCWQYVNYFFPDIFAVRYGSQSYIWPIRFAVSSLVIMFPLFIFVSWYLNKVYRKDSAVRESKIRKWLIYLTLFVAALVLAGDLVSVIYNFLGGEVTAKFILKALSVLVVAAAIFMYYLDDVRRSEPSSLSKYYAWGASAVLLVAIIGAFFVVGSPKQARLFQLDERRVGDLQVVQWQIVNYWQRKGQLPSQLTDLNDPIAGFVIPNDPSTGQPYEYNIKDTANLVFDLCANFDLPNRPQTAKSFPSPEGISQIWNHDSGRVCFERTIDQQLYPLIPKEKPELLR